MAYAGLYFDNRPLDRWAYFPALPPRSSPSSFSFRTDPYLQEQDHGPTDIVTTPTSTRPRTQTAHLR